MKIYLGIKFHKDMGNRPLIDRLHEVFKKLGMEAPVMIRDVESYGDKTFTVTTLMEETFKQIDSSDVVIIDLSEKGVGLGIEAGYAFAKGKPVWVIAKRGSDISETLAGIAKKVSMYNEPEDLLKEKLDW